MRKYVTPVALVCPVKSKGPYAAQDVVERNALSSVQLIPLVLT